jgi:starch phosphorylase
VEILEAVGADNFFQFGLTVDQVIKMRQRYSPTGIIASDKRLTRLFEAFDSGLFDGSDADLIRSVIDAARSPHDPWMTVADLPDYLDTQAQVNESWRNPSTWTQMSIHNTACSARFSTDRTMRDYNRDIWKLTPMQVSASSAIFPVKA